MTIRCRPDPARERDERMSFARIHAGSFDLWDVTFDGLLVARLRLGRDGDWRLQGALPAFEGVAGIEPVELGRYDVPFGGRPAVPVAADIRRRVAETVAWWSVLALAAREEAPA